MKTLRIRGVRLGFTLIELLLVIGIIAILASIVIVAVNPSRQLGQAKDTQRVNDINALLNAVYQYSIENNGGFPACLSAVGAVAAKPICKGDASDANCPGAAAASANCQLTTTLTPTFLQAIPEDPTNKATAEVVGTLATYLSGYSIAKDANGRITVSGTKDANTGGGAITVTR